LWITANGSSLLFIDSEASDLRVIGAGTAVPEGEGFGYFPPLMIKRDGKAAPRIKVMAYFCGEEGLCCFHSREFKLPIVVGEDVHPGRTYQ
jgi:hypothetical protein